jgi:hypothetical protein
MVSLRNMRSPNNRKAIAIRPNTSGLNILANAASGDMVVRPRVQISRTRRLLTSSTGKSIMSIIALKGVETFFPGAYLYPRLTVQLVLGLPQMVQAVRNRKPLTAAKAPLISIAWYITYMTVSGVIQSLLITKDSSMFGRATGYISKTVNKYVKGSASPNSVKFKIMMVIGHFLFAVQKFMGTAPYTTANNFSKRFAADFSGRMGASLANHLKNLGRAALRKPLRTAAATGAVAATMYASTRPNRTSVKSRVRTSRRAARITSR